MNKSIPKLIKDEDKAIKDYEDSAAKSKRPEVKKKFRHIKGEEKMHDKELKELKNKVASKMKK
jgi:rubrerythrin